MIKRESIDALRAQLDIVEVIGRYLPLKQAGKYYRGLCPFHPDKSPSFYVSRERQAYHCFGCGAGGSAINFVMQHEKLSFPEAVRLLAERAGITVEVEKTNVRYQPLYEACEFAAQFFSRQLAKYSAAVSYLLKRGMKDETVRRFRIGYAPGGNTLREAARKQGLNEELLLRIGLLTQREHGIGDWFYSRVICPIMSLSGRVIGFSGRVLDDSEPKYLNSSDSEIFHKRESLFGLFQAKNYLRAEPPILVEGNFDLLALANRGINSVVAPLGTAFTVEQALLIRRFNHQVRLLFDGDDAGRKAARRAVETLLKAGLEPSIVMLPAGYDPDDYIREFGAERLMKLIEIGVDAVEFLVKLRAPKNVAERHMVLREALQLVAGIEDDVMRELYLNRLSEEFAVGKDVLCARLLASENKPREPASDTKRPSTTRRSTEEQILALAAQNPGLARIARELMPVKMIGDARLSQIAATIYDLIAERNAGFPALIDALTDDDDRRRVAEWGFLELGIPTAVEYERLIHRWRSRWLCRAIADAEAQGDTRRLTSLSYELDELRKGLLPKRK